MTITLNKKNIFTIETASKQIKTPFYFPSISSIKSNYDFLEYFNILKKIGYPGFLVSAYDISHHEKRVQILKEISDLSENNTFVMIDSGEYESSWKQDESWSFTNFKKIIEDTVADFIFGFDVFWDDKSKVHSHVKETAKNAAMTAASQKMGITIPIIHSNIENYPDVVMQVVESINPQIIGIPERELGSSLLERAETLSRIRLNLIKNKRDELPIHLLGTGNPLSILIYFLCGADLFDALEWSTTVVDPKNGHLYHFTQKDLLECDCKACSIKNVPYHFKTMAHNLLFYEKFTLEIRKAVEENKIDSLLEKYLPKWFIPKIKKMMIRK